MIPKLIYSLQHILENRYHGYRQQNNEPQSKPPVVNNGRMPRSHKSIIIIISSNSDKRSQIYCLHQQHFGLLANISSLHSFGNQDGALRVCETKSSRGSRIHSTSTMHHAPSEKVLGSNALGSGKSPCHGAISRIHNPRTPQKIAEDARYTHRYSCPFISSYCLF